MRAVDLHTHSTASDGSYTPTELIDYAHEKGLASIAVTDHDTVAGLDEAIAAGSKYDDLEVIPGIEFSTVNEGKDVHVVGLYIDYKSPVFTKRLEEFRNSRIERNKKMCQKLTEAGLPMDYDELISAFEGSVLTRAHYAAYMLEKGYIKSRQEAFDRYIGDNCPCFVPRENVTPELAVEIILEAGGVPVLAHPVLYHLSDEKLDALVARMKAAGLMGIEAIYCTYSASDEREIKALAKKYDLLISGGSDFHGANKKDLDLAVGYGKLFVPEEVRDNIYNAYLSSNKN